MNPERIVELLEARPFKTFLVFVSTMDNALMIDDPKLARLHADGQTLIFSPHRASEAERWTRLIDLRSVKVVMVKDGKSTSE